MSAYSYGRVEGGPLSPRRRVGVPQPPTLLTTSLNNAHHLQHGLAGQANQVPMSATSLSSPFSLAAASPCSPATGEGLRAAASPMVAYNPQEWAGGNHGEQQYLHPQGQQAVQTVRYAPQIRGPDEPVRSPPPPYSSDPIDPSPADSNPSVQFSPQYVPSSASTMSPVWAGQETAPSTPYIRSPHGPSEQIVQSPQHELALAAARPPSARRAASTGDMHRAQPVRSPLAQTENAGPARHGYALPPPPPGPPPRNGRSISLSRAGESPGVVSSAQLAPRTRRPPALGTELGPVPPTPANWDEDAPNGTSERQDIHEYSRAPEALSLRTEGLNGSGAGDDATASSSSGGPSSHGRRESNSGLVRSPAVRQRSISALRERRTASRAGRAHNDPDYIASPVDEALAHPLENLVLTNKGSTLAERRRSTRISPRSGGSFQGIDAALGSERSLPPSARSFARTTASARSNIVEQTVEDRTNDSSTPVPSSRSRHAKTDDQPALLVSPRLPLSASAQSLLTPPVSNTTPSASHARPISHLLHMPNDDEQLKSQPILSPEITHSLLDFADEPSPRPLKTPEVFVAESLERHRAFAEKEAAASTDSERLQIFVRYMEEESKIRRNIYAATFEKERLKPSDLTSKMFLVPAQLPEPPKSAPLPGRSSSILGHDRRTSTSSSGTSFADSPQIRSRASTDATSDLQPLKLDTSSDTVRRREGAFVPALSPIASMSAVTGRDEMESRGRAPSRWWEDGSTSSGRGFDVMSRSKRESKYMSALIETDQFSDNDAAGPSAAPPSYDGPNGYPDEKAALKAGLSPATPHFLPKRAPFENRPGVLDVSRFTTLPPPYPRHHPAVNNSHPDLADTRAILRTLNDVQEATNARENFNEQASQKRSRADSWSAHQQSIHEQEMQFRISQNDITRREFDDANFALQDKIHSTKQKAVQSCFDLYQSMVVTPVHGFYSTRIAIANNTIDTLTNRLLERSSTPLPDQPQTEGDSQPELLEKLTLLKWLFEAREALHRAQFDVLSKRNDLYKELVLLPYKAPGVGDNPANQAKAAEAATFFQKDYVQREKELTESSLARWTSLHDTIRAAVTGGVEAQLSAFWDIAPQLQDLLQQISSKANIHQGGRGPTAQPNPAKLEILIPRHEVDENGSYWDHPLRYLYSVMGHAEASTRQFVEAQVSLWCLEQEIREGVVRAQAKTDAVATANEVEDELKRGVQELQEKVSVVEGQWAEGLGSDFESVKLAVRSYLEIMGGWDDELEGIQEI